VLDEVELTSLKVIGAIPPALDGQDFASPPVARIKIGRRIPFGFHGSWVPAQQLD
jgi:carotenoid cleavage dioxygenase-like enzyme